MAEKSGFGTGTILILVSAVLGYFVYNQTLAGSLGMVLLCVGLMASVFIGLIPFAGVFLEYFVDVNFVIPVILNFTGLWDTWLVTLMFGIAVVGGAFLTFLISVMVITD